MAELQGNVLEVALSSDGTLENRLTKNISQDLSMIQLQSIYPDFVKGYVVSESLISRKQQRVKNLRMISSTPQFNTSVPHKDRTLSAPKIPQFNTKNLSV